MRILSQLKQQLQPKLNVPRVAGGGDPAEGRGAEKIVRQVEVWMIEEIEGLGAKLQVQRSPKAVFFISETLTF